jgi:hypothetical protein
MADREPTPLDRTQLIEIWLNKFEFGKDNTEARSWLDYQPAKIGSALKHDADVMSHLAVMRKCIADFKDAHNGTSAEAVVTALNAALSANVDLRRIIAERTID